MPTKKKLTNKKTRKSEIAQFLGQILDKIISTDIDKLNEYLDRAQLIQIYPLIEATINYFKILKTNLGYFYSFRNEKRAEIEDLAVRFSEALEIIEDGIVLDLNAKSRTSFKNTITTLCEDLYEQLFNGLMRVSKAVNINKEKEADKMLQSIKEQKQESQKIISELKYSLEKQEHERIKQAEASERKIDKLIDTIQAKEEESKERLEEIKETESKFGTQTFSNIFEEQAHNNKQIARKWFITCGITALGISIFLGYVFYTVIITLKNINETNNLDPYISLQLFFIKLLIFSFLSIVFYQVIKNYNVNMHLYTTNIHRSNSLKTYPTFLANATTTEAKEIVLLQVTKCIFESGDTGYLSVKDHRIIPNPDFVLHKGK